MSRRNILLFATQADQKLANNFDRAVSSGRQIHHPSTIKMWANVDRSAGTPSLRSPSYNVDSVADGAAGNTTLSFVTDFASAVYAPIGNVDSSGTMLNCDGLQVGSVNVVAVNHDGTANDTADQYIGVFGDQVT